MDWTVTGQTTAAIVAATGFLLILLAGRREARGRLRESRGLVRLGGWPALAGSFSLALLGGIAEAQAIYSALLFCFSGFAALLAGLSGKPRPTGQIGAILFLAGLLVLAASI
jgi:hypothetical protein